MHIYSHIKNIMEKETGVRTIIEIGANTGEDTKRILNLSQPCKYYAFEPNPASHKVLNSLPIAHKIHIERCAVGNYDGFTQFNLCDCIHPVNGKRFTGASSILEPSDKLLAKHPWIMVGEYIDVPIVTLDTFTQKNNIKDVTFIWCDAQGAEGMIIEGGKETLKNTKYFYFEFFEQEMYVGCKVINELLDFLQEWEIIERYAGDVLVKNKRMQV